MSTPKTQNINKTAVAKPQYNGSAAHRENLEKARAAASRQQDCQHCGEKRSLGNIKKHEKSCYLNPENLKYCIVCENPIKNFRTSKTCGYSCANTHFRSGPNAGKWSDDTYRTTCFHHHKKRCVVCSEENIVAVHHLDEDRNNNEPSNLIPMCPTHHQYWHSKFRPLVERQVMEYIQTWTDQRTKLS